MLGIVAALVLLPAGPSVDSGYEFVPDTASQVGFRRREGEDIPFTAIGKLDAAGNFVPDQATLRVLTTRGGHPAVYGRGVINSRPGDAYEYRSGLLIRGRNNQSFNFVPDLGSRVIAFRDYLEEYRPGVSLRVYNLPGDIRPKAGAAPPPPPRGPAPDPPPPAVSGPPPPDGAYRFVPDTARRVEVRRGDGDRIYWSVGHLDADGTFYPDKDYVNRTGPKPEGAPAAVLLNADDLGAAYEYRSGRLIKGRIDPRTHNFIPELGSTVIAFASYRYGAKESRFDPDPLPIWNLPGSFQKKE